MMLKQRLERLQHFSLGRNARVVRHLRLPLNHSHTQRFLMPRNERLQMLQQQTRIISLCFELVDLFVSLAQLLPHLTRLFRQRQEIRRRRLLQLRLEQVFLFFNILESSYCALEQILSVSQTLLQLDTKKAKAKTKLEINQLKKRSFTLSLSSSMDTMSCSKFESPSSPISDSPWLEQSSEMGGMGEISMICLCTSDSNQSCDVLGATCLACLHQCEQRTSLR